MELLEVRTLQIPAMIQKLSQLRGRSIAVVLSLTVLTMGAAALRAKANGAPMIIELAHAQVTEIEGDAKFRKGDKGGYDFLQYMPTKIGDSITFSVPLNEAGHYSFQVTSYKDGEEGVYSIEVAGQELGRKDFYLSNVWEVGSFDVQPGIYSVTFRCVEKNPKSGGIGVELGNLSFR